VLGDDEYDRKSRELEEACFRLIALQQPVASDLRQLVAAIKIIADVERSADLCANIAKAARRIYSHELDSHLRGLIQKMGNQAQLLFKETTEAYLARRRVPCGRAVRHGHLPRRPAPPVHPDDLREPLVSQIDLQVGVQLGLVARFYERIGDHAVNVAGHTRYIASGWLPDAPVPGERQRDVPVAPSAPEDSG
jgi:phosphate transport system protein